MDLSTDFKAFQDLVQASLINVTKSATQVSNQDLSFHRSSSEKLSRSLDRQNAHLLRLTNKLLKAATQDTQLKPPSLQDQDGVEDNWRGVVDVVDGLLEKADSALDEFSGVIKPQSPAHNDGDSPKPVNTSLGLNRWAKDKLPKPQTLFDRKVNNSDPTPFKPLLQTKPHAMVGLEECVGNTDSGYNHPYVQEIEAYKYPSSVYHFKHPIPFTPIEESTAIYVDTEEGAREMLEELKKANEIAIDLEHNDMRSYVGLVCLMQISTRQKDWIIDTLKPWREKLQMLNEVFADPKILKVLHGSNMDIIWLQRDLGLYIVGLFDTFHAACALQFSGKGLKHLLLQFANVHAQKQFQLADWRIRPLPQELLDYARSDTHYLLTIYDHVRNMLVHGSSANVNLTNYVLEQSKKEALQVYTRQAYDLENGGGAGGWFGLLTMRAPTLSKEQVSVFRALHAWRDQKAREQDEGVQYILPNKTLWLVAENMPTSALTFHQACRGDAKFVSDRIPEIIEVVKKGKFEGKDGKSCQELIESSEKALGVTARKPRFQKKEQPTTTYSGLGETLKQLNSSREVASPSQNAAQETDAPIAVRSSTSSFWGQVTPQCRQLRTPVATATEALSSILPLLKLAAQSDPAGVEASATPPADKQVQVDKPKKITPFMAKEALRSKAKEIFTLNDISRSSQTGKKRKADATEEDESVAEHVLPGSTGPTPMSIPVTGTSPEQNAEQEPVRLSKKQKKAAKKARKAAEKAATEAAAQAIEPFDYASAPSLLTAPDNAPGGAIQGDVKRINPFARAMDTSTGAKRNKMSKELQGKSMTFKS